ncbi:MAG: ParB/RepB/Spo0J family partition protein, partial [Pseudomonadota bacterium]
MKRIALINLTLHPENVRSRSPEEYAPESVADLVGSIAADGLFQNLVVQQIEGETYGVLDGGRRLAALQILAERGDLAPDAKIDCRVVPKTATAVTAISIAANITQAPMKAIDQFDAFAKLIEDGLSVTDIAAKFGWTERGVRERLKYATIHPNIREAARQDIISLDTMKAFAAHPSMAVQLEVYEALAAEHELSSWKVRSSLK